MANYSPDLVADIEEAMKAARRTKRIMDRVHQRMGVVPVQSPTADEVYAATFEMLSSGSAPTEIDTTKRMASLAGELEHHQDPKVRSLAGLVLRHVRREEGEG